MQTLVVTSAVHKAAREFINDYNLAVLHNIVNIAFHNAVGAYCLIYMVGNGDIFGIVKVFNADCSAFLTPEGVRVAVCAFSSTT